jgi:hypothetical protein
MRADRLSMTRSWLRSLRRWGMPLDLHRGGDGAEPLVPLVPHLDDDVARLALCEIVAANLTRREDSSLYGSVQAGELAALVITGKLDIMDVEIVSDHTSHRRFSEIRGPYSWAWDGSGPPGRQSPHRSGRCRVVRPPAADAPLAQLLAACACLYASSRRPGPTGRGFQDLPSRINNIVKRQVSDQTPSLPPLSHENR